MRMRRTFLVLGMLALAFAVVGLMSVAEEETLKFGSDASSLGTLDPLYAVGHQNKPVVDAMFDGLVTLDWSDPNYESLLPELATSWDVSEDGLQITFTLREGVFFHGGYGEFTADDAVFSLQKLVNTDESAMAGYLASIDSIQAIDSHTVMVSLANPDPILLMNLAKYAQMLSKAAYEDIPQEEHSTRPIGTGPYILDELRPTESVVLVANADYWDDKPYFDRIEYLLLPDSTTRELAFLNGDLDCIRGVNDSLWIERMQEQSGVIVDIYPPTTYFPLIFNLTIEPFDDIRVRKAIAYAVDSQAVADYTGAHASVNKMPVPEIVGAATPEQVPPPPYYYEYDLDEARSLLAEAGYPNGFEFTTITSDRALYYDRMVMVQDMLKQVGITMNLEVIAHSIFVSTLREGETPFSIMGSNRFTAKELLNDFYHSASIPGSPTARFNFGFYSNPAVDALLDAADKLGTIEEAAPLWHAAERLIMDDLPQYPFFQAASAIVARHSYLTYPEMTFSLNTSYRFDLMGKEED